MKRPSPRPPDREAQQDDRHDRDDYVREAIYGFVLDRLRVIADGHCFCSHAFLLLRRMLRTRELLCGQLGRSRA